MSSKATYVEQSGATVTYKGKKKHKSMFRSIHVVRIRSLTERNRMNVVFLFVI